MLSYKVNFWGSFCVPLVPGYFQSCSSLRRRTFELPQYQGKHPLSINDDGGCVNTRK